MTIFYPDISSHESGISVAGASAVCCKVTEGTTYLNPYYAQTKADAAQRGVFFFAYHFLHQGSAAAQAQWAHSQAGSVPLMVDFEPTAGSSPTLADATAFIDTYRSLGGICELVYLPHWYWQSDLTLLAARAQARSSSGPLIVNYRSNRAHALLDEVALMGSPSLAPLVSRGMKLVSSDYTAYSDTGPGWAPYGGMTPSVWQYTDAQPFNGQQVDFNAFKGTVVQLMSVAGIPLAPVVTGLKWAVTDTFAEKGYQTGGLTWDEVPGAGYQGEIFDVATKARVLVFQTGVNSVQDVSLTWDTEYNCHVRVHPTPEWPDPPWSQTAYVTTPEP